MAQGSSGEQWWPFGDPSNTAQRPEVNGFHPEQVPMMTGAMPVHDDPSSRHGQQPVTPAAIDSSVSEIDSGVALSGNEQHVDRGNSVADLQSSLDEALQIDGALGVAIVDTASGMALGAAGSAPFDLNIAAAGNSTVVQAKLRTMKDLGLSEQIEDILITLDSQYHIIRTLGAEDSLFLYLVLDKSRANLALARFKLAKIESALTL